MIKSIFKWIGIILLTILLVGGSFISHEWYAEKPFMLRAFLDRNLVKMAFDSPEMLTSLGFLESIGIKGHNAELDDDSPEKAVQLFAELKQIHKTLKTYKDEDLDEDQQLSKEIAIYLMELATEFEPYRYHNYPVNQMFGVQNGYPSFMDAQHRVETVTDAENYISRLSKVKTKFQQNLQGLKIREQQGIIPPSFVIERVLKEMTDFVNQPVEENILYSSLKTKMEKTEAISTAEQAQLLKLAAVEIKKTVQPAYQLFISYFSAQADRATTDDGFWHLPAGDEAYNLALRFFTTTDYSAEQIHSIGLAEVDRIQQEIVLILQTEGFDISQGFTTAIEKLKADPKFYYPDTDEGREQILMDYQSILDQVNTGLDEAFNVRPKAAMKVRRIPEFKEATAPGAYYEQPSLDGTRPGMFFANLYDIKATPRYGMRTLAYHEGIPGHHFQVAISMELEGLPLFRKMSPFVAYTEGWALYAERLAWELGFQDNPFDNIGRLQAELFRAVRLVVDTGIHHSRWTREEAIEYMLKNTGIAESDVVSEIERYIVLPAQATSYKVGMMKILELREKAKTVLGDKFNLSDFHDAVLKNGAVPLSILERLIDRYIDDTINQN